MKKLLWLDDYRDPMQGQWLVFSPITLEDLEVFWVKSYKEFTEWITENGLPDAICFDHDLADIHYRVKDLDEHERLMLENDGDIEKTGYDCAKWLVEYCTKHRLKLPLYNIQSANMLGKENIDKHLKNYIKPVEQG